MEIKKMFGLLGFTLLSALTSNIVIECLIRDIEIIRKEVKKYDKIIDKKKQSK